MKKRKSLLFIGVLALSGVGMFLFIMGYLFPQEEKFVIPENYQEYSNENFYFKYLPGYEVLKFDDDEGRLGTIRIRVTDNTYIDLEHMAGYTESALEMAERMNSSRDHHAHNRSPQEIPNKNLEGYYGTRFLKNIDFSSLQDYAYFDTSKGLFELSISFINDDQELYDRGHQAFLLILNTLEVKF